MDRLTLQGIHSKFFPFEVGCSVDDCTPNYKLVESGAPATNVCTVLMLLATALALFKL